MDNEKTCPKCPNSPTMNKLDRKSIVPDLTRLMLMRSNVWIYLQAFECPNCKLVEFYRIER
jgi:predicted nucleic-acid-binding Zn-ribbon protein